MIELFHSGGPVMYPLLACSVVVLTVIVERFMFWNRIDRDRRPAVLAEVLALSQRGDWAAVKTTTRTSRDYIVKILITGILHREFSMVKAMEAAAGEQLLQMRRYMSILDTMITVAPLLGIFGTVIGIIQSFEMLGAGGIEHPEAVTAGIAQALITTATGLGIAILTVLPYNYFNARVDAAALAMEQYATSLEVVYDKISNGDGEAPVR